MMGDSLSDIEFGRRLGMICTFIEGDPARRQRRQAHGGLSHTYPAIRDQLDLIHTGGE
jgi:hypothetical protein